MEEKTPQTAFDSFKNIELKKKKMLYSKILNDIKKLSKGIFLNKEKCNLLLNELSVSDKEKKQIIDWINNLEDVKINDDDIEKIKNSIKKDLQEKKEEITEKSINNPLVFCNQNTPTFYNTAGTTETLTIPSWHYSNTAITDPNVLCNNKENEIIVT